MIAGICSVSIRSGNYAFQSESMLIKRLRAMSRANSDDGREDKNKRVLNG